MAPTELLLLRTGSGRERSGKNTVKAKFPECSERENVLIILSHFGEKLSLGHTDINLSVNELWGFSLQYHS